MWNKFIIVIDEWGGDIVWYVKGYRSIKIFICGEMRYRQKGMFCFMYFRDSVEMIIIEILSGWFLFVGIKVLKEENDRFR